MMYQPIFFTVDGRPAVYTPGVSQNGRTVAVDADEVSCWLLKRLAGMYNAEFGENIKHDDFTEWSLTSGIPAHRREEHPKALHDYLLHPNLYDEIEPMPGAIRGIMRMRAAGYRVVFVTAAVGSGEQQKKKWFIRNGLLPVELGEHQPDYFSAHDKSAFAKFADLLIDDKPDNHTGFLKGILFSRRHNRDVQVDNVKMFRAIQPGGASDSLDSRLIHIHEDSELQWEMIPDLVDELLKPREWPTLGSQPGIPGLVLPAEMLAGKSILAVSGKINSGKSHMGRIAVRRGYVPIAYANPFKFLCVSHDGLPANEVFGSKKSPEVRNTLQRRGSEEARDIPDIGEDVWLRGLEAQMWYLFDSGVEKIMVTDCRFRNEAAQLKALGGKVVRVAGRETEALATPEAKVHRSETELDSYEGFDLVLDNSLANQDNAAQEFTQFVTGT